VLSIIKAFDPRAFYSVDEIQTAAAGVFPAARRRPRAVATGPWRVVRPDA
jgi:hypothetical protein